MKEIIKKLIPLLFTLPIFLLIPVNRSSAQISFDPFERYGKHLPWVKDEVLVLTFTPDQHYQTYGYYSQNFAKNGGPIATLGIPVHAFSDGIVEDFRTDGYNNGAGRYVTINHLNGYKSKYYHMHWVALTQSDLGQPIRAGQEIGTIGDSGFTTGPNLEFILEKNGIPVKVQTANGPIQGEYSWSQQNVSWINPVDNFDKFQGSIFKSHTQVRGDDPNPPVDPNGHPWSPRVIDALDRYMRFYGSRFPSGMIGEPVNTALGSFIHKSSDLEFPNTNKENPSSLYFERFYNSPDNYAGLNGKGWANNLDIKIVAHADNQYSVKFGDGKGETFVETDNDPNTFTPTFNNITPESLGTLKRYDASNAYKFEYKSADNTSYLFNSNKESPIWGKVEKITSLDGRNLVFEYDANGNLSKVTSDLGKFITFNFSGSNLLNSISDSAGRSVSYQYNFDGRLEKVTKSNGGDWFYTYDANGQITSIKDANGKIFVTNTYVNGKVAEQTDANGHKMTFEYSEDATTRTTKIKDGRGNTTEHIHNTNYYLAQKKTPNGHVTKYEYNTKGQKTAEILPLGQRFTYEYDSNGNQTKEIKPNGYTKATEYNSLNLPTKITDPSGSISLEYDNFGNLTKTINQKSHTTLYEYNPHNFVSKITDPRSGSQEFKYDNSGNLTTEINNNSTARLENIYDAAGNKTEVKDSLGGITKFTYDSLGNATKITDPRGGILSFEYDQNGNLIKKTDEAGATTTYESDGNENIVKITYPNNGTEEFLFDANNNKIQEKDRNGNITKYEYDNDNRLAKEIKNATSAVPITLTYAYDANNNLTLNTDPKGNQTKFEYDELGQIIKEINPLNYSKEYKYDLLSRLSESKDWEGNITKYEYDSLGNKTKETNALGSVTEYSYDELNNLISQKDALGNTTLYAYDLSNHLIEITNSKGEKSKYTYNIVGQLTAQSNFANESTTYQYDNAGNIISKADPLENTMSFGYDLRNHLTKVTDPNGNQTNFSYDVMGDKLTDKNALGATANYEYDKNGNLLKYISENGSITAFNYDGLNQLINEIDPNGKQTTYEYDQNGNIVKNTNKNGNSTSYAYDDLDRLTTIVDPLNKITRLQYSPNGNLIKQIEPLGNTTTFTYDSLNRKIQTVNPKNHITNTVYDKLDRPITTTDAKGKETKVEYDSLGNVTKIIDRKGRETSFTYDPENRLIQTTLPLGVISKKEYDVSGRLIKDINSEGGITKYAYDSASNITGITNPRNLTTKFEYDKLNRKTKTIDANNGVSSTKYDSISRIIENIDPNGNKSNYEYDSVNNLTKLTNPKGGISGFTYDNEGNLLSTTNPRGFTTSFEYDKLNRDIKTTLPDGSVYSKTYDALGRVTNIINPKNQETKTTYDPIGNILEEFDSANFKNSYQYDENNNIISITDRAGSTTTFTYDENDQLVLTRNPLRGTKEYSYDDLDRLITKKDEKAANTKYEYDKLNRVTKEINALNYQTTNSYDSNSNLIKSIDPSSRETTYSYDNLDRISSITNPDNGVKKFNYDKVGNLLNLTDENGNTTNYAYDPLNNLIKTTDALGYSTTLEYDANNNKTKIIDGNNHIIQFGFDNRDRLNSKTLPNGEVFKYEYDALENLTKSLNPKGNSYTYEYDNRNLLTKKSDPLGNSENYQYDALERLVTQTNPEGKNTSYNYDALSRLTQVTDALDSKTSYEYDEVSNLLREINANGKATTYQYDNLNRKTKEIDALSNSWNFEYSPTNQLIKRSNPNGSIIDYTYDELDRVKNISGKSNNTNSENIIFSYDKVGNVTKVTNPNSNNEFVYDKKYQILKSVETTNGTTYNSSFSYDPVGNRTQIIYPDAKIANYSYNPNDQLASLSIFYKGDELTENTPRELTSTFSYDANLNPVKQTNPNNTEIVREYDNADRLTKISNNLTDTTITDPRQKILAQYTYDLNKNGDKIKEHIIGKIQSLEDGKCENIDHDGSDGHEEEDCDNPSIPGNHTEEILDIVRNYEYDPIRRLTKVTENKVNNGNLNDLALDYWQSFNYDKVGNRLRQEEFNQKENKLTTTNYTYNDINQLISDTGFNYTYDKNGNRLTKMGKDGKTYSKSTYNAFDELVSNESKQQIKKNNKTEDFITNFEYKYDGLGRRVSKINNTDYSKYKGNLQKKSLPYYGIKNISYAYDGKSWESLSEYYDRIEAPNHGNPHSANSYFDLHTNYYKYGRTIIASDDTAHRALPDLGLHECPGNSDGKDDSPDCNNGGGNDDKPIKNQELIKNNGDINLGTSHSNQRINYYHYDRLGNVVGRTKYSFSYIPDQNNSYSVKVNNPKFRINEYEEYGNLEIPIGKNRGQDKKIAHIESLYPSANGFNSWNNKTYSAKELDSENNNYYYGSRFYDPRIGLWNRQDDYRGTLNDPMSRHRYAFVNDNPGNNVDQYGYCISCLITTGYNLYKASNAVVDSYVNLSKQQSAQINAIQSKIDTLNNNINIYPTETYQTSYSYVTQTIDTPTSYQAKRDYYDWIAMKGMVGRLEAKGYKADYRAINNYISSQMSLSWQKYNSSRQVIRTLQKTVYRNTVSNSSQINRMIQVLENYKKTYQQQLRFSSYIGQLKGKFGQVKGIFDKLRSQWVTSVPQSPFIKNYFTSKVQSIQPYYNSTKNSLVGFGKSWWASKQPELKLWNTYFGSNSTEYQRNNAWDELNKMKNTQNTYLNYDKFDKTLEYMYNEMKTNATGERANNIREMIEYDSSFTLGTDPMSSQNYEFLFVGRGTALMNWADIVKTGAEWDHKPKLDGMFGLGPQNDYYYPIRGDWDHEYFYDIWSNIHYGYVGSAIGFSGETLITGANIKEREVGIVDPADDLSMKIGIGLWNKYGNNLTKEELHMEILSHKYDYLRLSEEYIKKQIDAGVKQEELKSGGVVEIANGE